MSYLLRNVDDAHGLVSRWETFTGAVNSATWRTGRERPEIARLIEALKPGEHVVIVKSEHAGGVVAPSDCRVERES